MQMIKVSKLREHPRNSEFFDNIEGDKWKDFLKSIERRGVVEAIVVTQDLVIVSGHQRVRASKELKIDEIPCRITHYDNEEKILEDLISTNILQRGIGNVNPMKMARCVKELEKIYGIRQGGDRGNQYKVAERHNVALEKSQSDLANQIGIDQRQLQRYKKLTNLIPELQDLVETNQLKATTAYKIWAKMPQDEQEKFFNDIGSEKVKAMTQRETKEVVDKLKYEKKELEKAYDDLSEKYNKELKREKIIEVDNTDYTVLNKNKELEQKLKGLCKERDNLQTRLRLMSNKADAYKQDSLEYEKIKNDITYLTNEKDDLSRQVQAITDISGLVVEIDHLIKGKLAPVRYSKSLLEAKDNEIVIKNLTEIVNVIEEWCYEMKGHIPNKINYVEVIQ